MGITERKERERHEMEKLILDAAMKLFLKDGYKNVSIRKIASAIEYSPGTIYLYFKDKDEIFFTLQNMAFEKFYNAQMSSQGIEDPLERLLAHGRVYVEFALENNGYYDLMFIMEEPVKRMINIEQWRAGSKSYNLLKQNVRDCIDKGQMKIKDVETAAFSMWSYVHGVASLTIKRGFILTQEAKAYLINGALENLRTLLT